MLSVGKVVNVVTDHNNLKYFLTTKKLSGRQARAAEALSQYNIEISFRAGKKNPADGLSRRPDYEPEEGSEADTAMLPVLQELFSQETRRLYTSGATGARERQNDAEGPTVEKQERGNTKAPGQRRLHEGATPGLQLAGVGTESPHVDAINMNAPGQRRLHEGATPGLQLAGVGTESSNVDAIRLSATELESDVEEIVCSDGGPIGHGSGPKESVPGLRSEGAAKNVRVDGVTLRPRRVPPEATAEGCIGAVVQRRRGEGVRTPDYAGRLAVNDGSPRREFSGRSVASSPHADDGETTSPSSDHARGTAVVINRASEQPEEALDANDEDQLAKSIRREQQRDAFIENLRKQLGSESLSGRSDGDSSSWSWSLSGLLLQNGKVYVPASAGLRKQVIEQCHNDPSAGHAGVAKSQSLHIRQCDTCQSYKKKSHRPYGALQSLQVPNSSEILSHWSMDFVVGLPLARTRRGEIVDAVLVIVDRLSKYALYIPVPGNIDGSSLADVVEEAIVARFGTPMSIVSDRGSLFTSKFWGALMRRWHTKGRLSTAFHPQTDGLTERQNQTMEAYLRCYINYDQDDWPYWLIWAEAAYNGAEHASLRCSPCLSMGKI